MPTVSLECSDLSPAECYDLLVSIVVPRPIALVSTLSKDGQPNLAPFSYFQIGGSSPPSVMISPTLGPDGREKHTLRNIRETGEYVINAVTRAMSNQMNSTSAPVSEDESEWSLTCFTAEPGKAVKPARVVESPLSIECRLHEILRHGEGLGAANYVIGEVVMFHIEDSMLVDGAFSGAKMRPVGRMGSDLYIDTAVPEVFRMPRPQRSSL